MHTKDADPKCYLSYSFREMLSLTVAERIQPSPARSSLMNNRVLMPPGSVGLTILGEKGAASEWYWGELWQWDWLTETFFLSEMPPLCYPGSISSNDRCARVVLTGSGHQCAHGCTNQSRCTDGGAPLLGVDSAGARQTLCSTLLLGCPQATWALKIWPVLEMGSPVLPMAVFPAAFHCG